MKVIRSVRFWVVAAFSVLAFGGVAYATIPGGDGVIHGCYAKTGGTLRVIDASTTNCKSGEATLDWNQQGVPGPKGDTGPVGPQGEKGAPGGVAGYEIVTSQGDLTSNHSQYRQAMCPAGKVAIGGGAALQGDFEPYEALDNSGPLSDGSGWGAQAHEVVSNGMTWRIVVKAICAFPA